MGLFLHEIGHFISRTLSTIPASLKIIPSGLAQIQGLTESITNPHFNIFFPNNCLNSFIAIDSVSFPYLTFILPLLPKLLSKKNI